MEMESRVICCSEFCRMPSFGLHLKAPFSAPKRFCPWAMEGRMAQQAPLNRYERFAIRKCETTDAASFVDDLGGGNRQAQAAPLDRPEQRAANAAAIRFGSKRVA